MGSKYISKNKKKLLPGVENIIKDTTEAEKQLQNYFK